MSNPPVNLFRLRMDRCFWKSRLVLLLSCLSLETQAAFLEITGFLAANTHSISVDEWPVIQFGAVSNKTYTLQYCDGLAGPVWKKLVDILPQRTNRIERIIDPFAGTNRYYRLTTPRQP